MCLLVGDSSSGARGSTSQGLSHQLPFENIPLEGLGISPGPPSVYRGYSSTERWCCLGIFFWSSPTEGSSIPKGRLKIFSRRKQLCVRQIGKLVWISSQGGIQIPKIAINQQLASCKLNPTTTNLSNFSSMFISSPLYLWVCRPEEDQGLRLLVLLSGKLFFTQR